MSALDVMAGIGTR